MKSIISLLFPEKPVKSFPKLMISFNNEVIVLMIKKDTGTIVYSIDSSFPIGRMSNNWDSRFRDYDGSVTLSND